MMIVELTLSPFPLNVISFRQILVPKESLTITYLLFYYIQFCGVTLE